MIANVRFMITGTSESARRFELINVGDFTYPVATDEYQASNVKCTDDFEQSIIVPYFDSWKKVDTVVIFPNTMTKPSYFSDIIGVYLIENRRITSITQEAVQFDLRYNAVASNLQSGDSITGIWARCPTLYTPWITQVPVSDALKPSRYYNLDSSEILYPNSANPEYIFWVQVTATKDLNGANSNRLTTYGFPVIFPINYSITSIAQIPLAKTYYDNGSVAGTSQNDLRKFPGLAEFINNPTTIGLQASEITDISITRMCPYYYSATPFIVSGTSQISNAFKLIDGNGRTTFTIRENGTYCYYNISNDNWSTGTDYRQTTVTVTLTDTEIQTGKVYIRDADGNYCLEIPTSWFDSDNSLKVVIQCHADYGQLYYHIGIDTDTAIGVRKTIALPCSHLPYIGTAWNEYRAFSQVFDREQMYYSVAQTAINTGAGLASGNAFAVGNAIGTVGNIAGSVYSQNLKERRLQAQPARGYALGYGISYITKLLEHPHAIVIETPANLTNTIYNNYVSDYGYAVEGRQTLTITNGYYEGIAFGSSSICGAELEYLNDELRNGVRII